MMKRKFTPAVTICMLLLSAILVNFINVDCGLYWVFPQQILFFIADLLMLFLLFEGKATKKLMLVILMEGIAYTANFIVLPCTYYLVQQGEYNLKSGQLYNICEMLTLILGAIVYEWVIKHSCCFQGEISRKGVCYLFAISLFVRISVIFMAQSLIESENFNIYKMLFSTLAAMSGMLLLLFSIYFVDRSLVLILMEYQNQMLEHHMAAMVQADKQISEFRHDFKNHMICLENLLQAEKRMEAKHYLHELTKSVVSFTNNVSTGNAYADAVLKEKYAVADANGIVMLVDMIFPERNMVLPIDLCIILSNALDNAIEACSSVKKISSDKKLEIKAKSYIRRSCLMIEIHNTSLTENGSVKRHFRDIHALSTAKSNKQLHGIGLSNIKAAVERYHGVLDLWISDGEFHFCAMLPLCNNKGLQ